MDRMKTPVPRWKKRRTRTPMSAPSGEFQREYKAKRAAKQTAAITVEEGPEDEDTGEEEEKAAGNVMKHLSASTLSQTMANRHL